MFNKKNIIIIYLSMINVQFLFSAILHTNINKIISLFLLLVIFITIKKKVINKLGLFWILTLFIINGIAILHIFTIYDINNFQRTFQYSIFKIVEFFLILSIVTSLNKKEINYIFVKFRLFFLMINIPLFVYYLGAYMDLLPSINRIIIFDNTRFGALLGEPRDLGLYSLILFISTYYFKRYNYITIERIILMIFIISSMSNAVLISFILLGLGYMLIKRQFLFLIMSLSIVIVFYIMNQYDIVLGRLDMDYKFLYEVIFNYDFNIDPGGLNAINIRMYNFMYNIHWMMENYIGYGIGSSIDIANINNLFSYNVYNLGVGLFGFPMIGVELGIFGLIFLFISIYIKLIKLTITYY